MTSFSQSLTTVDKEAVLGLWTWTFDWLRKHPDPEWVAEKYFTNGTFDSIQSPYEQMANQLKLAVKARSDVEGRILHLALRCILNKYDFDSIAEIMFGDIDLEAQKITPDEDFIQHLGGFEGDYISRFDKGQPLTSELIDCLILPADEPLPDDIDRSDEKVKYTYLPEWSNDERKFVSLRRTVIRRPEEVIVWDINSIEAALKTMLTKMLICK